MPRRKIVLSRSYYMQLERMLSAGKVNVYIFIDPYTLDEEIILTSDGSGKCFVNYIQIKCGRILRFLRKRVVDTL